MLIVDIYALHLIYTLNFFDEILVYAFHTVNSQNIMRIERTLSDTVSSLDKVSFFYLQTRAVRDDIDHLLVAHNFDFCFIVFSRFDGHHRTVSFADFCETLRLSRLEKFFYSRKTLGNIPAGYTARMERTHGELCARFSDGLCRHDTDRLADIDSLPGSQTSSITFSADADGTLAGEYRTNLD